MKRKPNAPYPCRQCHHPFTPGEIAAKYGKRSTLYKAHVCSHKCIVEYVASRMQRFADKIKDVTIAFQRFTDALKPGGIATIPIDMPERIVEVCQKNKVKLLFTIHHKINSK